MKLEGFGDLFKNAKELLDDDYQHDSLYSVKTKQKGSDGVTVSAMKFIKNKEKGLRRIIGKKKKNRFLSKRISIKAS